MGFELNGNYLFYDKDAVAVERILRTNLLSQENVLGKVKVTGFPSEQWAAESKKLWAAGNNVYLAGLNEDGSHHQAISPGSGLSANRQHHQAGWPGFSGGTR